MTDLFGDVATILFNNGRSIGGVIPDVPLSEKHSDTISITSHPVERGAAITDHAFVNPAQLNMEIGFSDCSLRALTEAVENFDPTSWTNENDDFFASILNGTWGETYSITMYKQLIALQRSREPLRIVTRKRVYENMLLQSVTTGTDPAHEYSAVILIVAQEILLVSTQTSILPAMNRQASPVTAPIQDFGVKSVQPLSNRSPLLPGAVSLPGG
ncbi:phage baseplate protein [Entomobacter blattae]|uniref:Dit-like phage tail protein N-terminal domain-containing protein n=1 Tax=Entomobacter blattae TaxID=2762277 RepID=A0A7H1NTS9_9PROT|nr:hypothetical protein [Entomobacter blattae]QNT79189.1 hypothetical protein JGUZn3_19840 [Entomobacter blattae]